MSEQCPDCGTELIYESPVNRDTETMGGLAVEYFCCESCRAGYSKVEGSENLCLEYPIG